MANLEMAESTDVVIIGTGPAGIMAAIEATRRNVDVIIFEEHEIVGCYSINTTFCKSAKFTTN